MRAIPIIALLLWAVAGRAASPTTCGATDPYGKALCAYQQARTDMKTGRFDEAATLFIRIHDLDPAFYTTWNCDFLLGECRKATGKDG